MIEKKLLTASLAFGLAASWMVPAQADLSAFKKQFTSKNSWEQAAAIRLLDGKDKKEYEVLSDLLKAVDWYLRDAVIEVLSTSMADAEAAKWMEKDLKKGKTYVAEGIALAIGRSADSSKVPWLVEALTHKEWQIRRSAAIALKEVPDKRAVEPLLEAWKNELKKGKQFRVWTRCVEALEDITGEKFDTLGDWENWWKYNKDAFAVGGKKKGEESKSGTVLRGVELNYDTAGDGGPLLVIPDYGFEKSYMKTYLRNLEEFNQCIYMDLPGAANFDPPLPKDPGLPAPTYPLEKISAAFEELIKKMAEEGKLKKKGKDVKVNVFCHGMSGWIGMAYAAKFPGSVRRLVLCNPFSSGKAWGDGNGRLVKKGQANGDLELEHFANSRIFDTGAGKSIYTPSAGDESDALSRKGFTDYFADVRDSEIGVILGPKVTKKVGGGEATDYKVYRPMGGVMIPSDFKVQALPSVPVPTMIIVGKHATMTSIDDCNAIAKHYPSSTVIVFDRSSMMPFIEENTKFVSAVNKFLN